MAYNAIVNGAPFINLLGTQDKSTRALVREPIAVPTHLPKFYIFAKKGPTTPQLAVGGSRSLLYGEETFDLRSKWANHATVFANGVNAEGNSCMYERVIPTDAGPEANLFLSLEVVEDEVDDYDRNTDGSIKTDATGNPVVLGQITGYKARWVVSGANTVADLEDDFGARIITAGTIPVTGSGTATAQIFPIMDLKMSYVGADGNNSGIRLWSPNTTTGGQFDKRVLSNDKVYPFRIAVIRRSATTGTAKVEESNFGEQSVLTSFKPGAVSSVTDSQLFIGNNFLNAYRNVDDPAYPPVMGEFGDMHIYSNNVQNLLEMFYIAEKDYIDGSTSVSIMHDFPVAAGANPDDAYLFNMLTGASSQAYPYHTFQLVSGGGAVQLGEYTNLYANGSSDGTMTDAAFAALVAERVAEYQNDNSSLMNTALNVESIVYDSGFPLATKYALCGFISQRKDTFVALGTDRKSVV